MRHKFILDRFEGDFAVLTDEMKKSKIAKKTELPDNVFEGAMIYFENGAYFFDREGTKARQREAYKKMNRYFE